MVKGRSDCANVQETVKSGCSAGVLVVRCGGMLV